MPVQKQQMISYTPSEDTDKAEGKYVPTTSHLPNITSLFRVLSSPPSSKDKKELRRKKKLRFEQIKRKLLAHAKDQSMKEQKKKFYREIGELELCLDELKKLRIESRRIGRSLLQHCFIPLL